MKIIKTVAELQLFSDSAKASGHTVGLVPTMGYLHKGHLSLVEMAKKQCGKVITTLFVNPTQFAPGEDFESYPRDLERDSKMAVEAGTDIFFAPETREIYPVGYSTSIRMTGITEKFEGQYRTAHFNGVATVVAKLFNAARPDKAYFGQKDYQQTLVIKKLNSDMNFGIDIVVAPIIREADGLAMSSRNIYLDKKQRKVAGILFAALEEAKAKIARGERNRIVINSHMHAKLREVPGIRLDYAECANAQTLEKPETFLPGEEIVLLIACYIGKTRLIDNALVSIPAYDDKFEEGI